MFVKSLDMFQRVELLSIFSLHFVIRYMKGTPNIILLSKLVFVGCFVSSVNNLLRNIFDSFFFILFCYAIILYCCFVVVVLHLFYLFNIIIIDNYLKNNLFFFFYSSIGPLQLTHINLYYELLK